LFVENCNVIRTKEALLTKADLAERKCLEHHRVKAKEIYFTEAVKSHLTIESFKGYG